MNNCNTIIDICQRVRDEYQNHVANNTQGRVAGGVGPQEIL